MTIHVLAFARVRELIGDATCEIALEVAPTVGALRDVLEMQRPQLAALRSSTRVARNGTIVDDATELCDGDEVAFLPPVGGG